MFSERLLRARAQVGRPRKGCGREQDISGPGGPHVLRSRGSGVYKFPIAAVTNCHHLVA